MRARNGLSWSALGSGMGLDPNFYSLTVDALTVFDDGGGPALFAGGRFSTAGGRVSVALAKWSSVVETNDFVDCLKGPDLDAPMSCPCSDRDLDGDVDLADFRRVQNQLAP